MVNKNTIMVAGFFLLCTIGFFYVSSLYKTEKLSERLCKKLYGTYLINITRSDLRSYNPELFGDLQITFHRDKTFYLSKEVPFFCGKNGTWKCSFDGEVEIDELKFKGTCNTTVQFGFTDSTVMISYPKPKKGNDFANLVYFEK